MMLLTDNDLRIIVKDEYRRIDGWRPNARDYFEKIRKTSGLLTLKLLLE